MKSPVEKTRYSFILRALKYRNYRLFFMGQIVSLIGSWMTITASAWLVYRLTGSAKILGIVGFSGLIPSAFLAPFAGVFVDRWNKRRLLILTQTLSMLQSFALAYLALTGKITIASLVVLNVFQGVVNAFDMPCRQSFVVSLIENKEDLGNAIALNSTMVNAARLLGPSLAGILVAAAGEGWCFFVDGVSFLAVIFSLTLMVVKPRAPMTHVRQSPWGQFYDGWKYTFGFASMRSIIFLLAIVSLVGVPYTVLMPIFAGKILHGGPHTLGFLMTASGCGALAGALWLASRRSILGLSRVIPLSAALFGGGLMAFSFSRTLWISIPLMALMGFGFMTQMASSNTLLQTIVDDEKRGRVMSFFMLAFLGAAPFGNLLAGLAAEKIGAPRTIFLGGAACVLGAFFFLRSLPAFRNEIRPLYVRRGILPEEV